MEIMGEIDEVIGAHGGWPNMRQRSMKCSWLAARSDNATVDHFATNWAGVGWVDIARIVANESAVVEDLPVPFATLRQLKKQGTSVSPASYSQPLHQPSHAETPSGGDASGTPVSAA